ncbi:PREDICTED: uncharacterized protein LOC104814005 [Tarenaya hassleriana]|uniref:uncharacterized protein LOC104814005 n=1 Tax=Tarenaya hassleriana TaxID=28532 RepID=UPI00053C90D8|nr:PREDICTED: uncharacterized protein LOC104814005 [Tarenaya hassleriana]
MEDKNEYGLWMPVKEEEFQEQDVWDGDPKNNHKRFRNKQHSAPVSVPDWSRIHTIKPKKAAKTHDDDDGDDGDDYDDGGGGGGSESVLPEEYFMGRIRSSPSLSVMEGAGRTLKGKDLSKVRNAVLKKTGFLE